MRFRHRLIFGLMLLTGAGLLVLPSVQSWIAWGADPGAAERTGPARQVWILRQSFAKKSPRRNSPPSRNPAAPAVDPQLALPSDLRQRLEACGAAGIEVQRLEEAGDLVCCRCQLAVSGTHYARRFECRDTSADLAGRRLLLDLQRWIARQQLSRARH